MKDTQWLPLYGPVLFDHVLIHILIKIPVPFQSRRPYRNVTLGFCFPAVTHADRGFWITHPYCTHRGMETSPPVSNSSTPPNSYNQTQLSHGSLAGPRCWQSDLLVSSLLRSFWSWCRFSKRIWVQKAGDCLIMRVAKQTNVLLLSVMSQLRFLIWFECFFYLCKTRKSNKQLFASSCSNNLVSERLSVQHHQFLWNRI